MNKTPKRALLWIAVSSEEQARENKASIPTQLADGKKRAESEGWQIIDTLISDGHSRSYIDIYELAKDARDKGIHAFDTLIDHLKSKQDFDVLWCWSADRLGRSQTIIAFITEHVFKCGASIYVESDKQYKTNDRFFAMVEGYTSSKFIDDLKRKIRMGHENAIANGSAIGRMPSTHKRLYDENHNEIGVGLADGIELEYARLADLLIYGHEGQKISYNKLEHYMFEIYGYGKNGKRHRRNHYYYRLCAPSTWGHLTLGRNRKGAKLGSFRRYIVEDGHPIPDGLTIEYNVFPPVYTGDIADRVKRVMFDRMSQRGKGAHKPKRYTGVFVCAECDRLMTHKRNKENREYILCEDAYKLYADSCNNKKSHRISNADEWVFEWLNLIASTGDMSYVNLPDSDVNRLELDIEDAQSRIQELNNQLDKLIDLQLDSTGAMLSRYIERGNDIANQIDILKQRLSGIQSEYRFKQKDTQSQQRVIQTLQDMGVNGFKNESALRQNSIIKGILGDYVRIGINRKGEIGLHPYSQSNRRKRKY
jgi:DNA invertase Pin-like site-specific DNA recombinase